VVALNQQTFHDSLRICRINTGDDNQFSNVGYDKRLDLLSRFALKLEIHIDV